MSKPIYSYLPSKDRSPYGVRRHCKKKNTKTSVRMMVTLCAREEMQGLPVLIHWTTVLTLYTYTVAIKSSPDTFHAYPIIMLVQGILY